MTPSEIFKEFSDDFLSDLASEVLEQEACVLLKQNTSQKAAVQILLARTGVADERTAERQVVNCTRNEVFARWVALMKAPVVAMPFAATAA